jgi:hypothetical protein
MIQDLHLVELQLLLIINNLWYHLQIIDCSSIFTLISLLLKRELLKDMPASKDNRKKKETVIQMVAVAQLSNKILIN